MRRPKSVGSRMGGMRQEVRPRDADLSESSGRTGLSALFTGRRRRPAILLTATVVGLATLGALRQTAPTDPDEKAARPRPEQSLPVRFTPSPTATPRGSLPRPDVVDRSRNRIIGDLPSNGQAPGERAVLSGVAQILDWYCPESTDQESSVDQLRGWESVRVVVRPRPDTPIELFLNWKGETYRWQGPHDTLDRCW